MKDVSGCLVVCTSISVASTYGVYKCLYHSWFSIFCEDFFDRGLWPRGLFLVVKFHHHGICNLYGLCNGYVAFITFTIVSSFLLVLNYFGDVMVSMFTSSVVDRGFERRSCQNHWYLLILRWGCSITAKSKDYLAPNQDNVSEWSEMSIRGLLFQ